ncbi:MAG: hypothetical protein WBQ18_10240, partial [Solirubrobacteraceae bacterium]
VVSVAGLIACARVVARQLPTPAEQPGDRARLAHVAFWAGALLCAAAAYVFTNVALAPSDRYIIIAVPAVAALVPLLIAGRGSRALVGLGAAVFVSAGLVALGAGDAVTQIYRGAGVPRAAAIERLTRSLHLTVGYAGYWDAASLTWSSDGRLDVYPVMDIGGVTERARLARADAWYAPRAATPSYLVLAPHDGNLPDRLPPQLPRPQRLIRLGSVTVAVWRYDIARFLGGPLARQIAQPAPGVTR